MAPVTDVNSPELVMDLKFVRAKGLASNGNEYPRPNIRGSWKSRDQGRVKAVADVVDCFKFEERLLSQYRSSRSRF